ncbi:MAG: MYG1 family protein [Candidatus Pacebacteria bacterium]|nr:MYG1 family protein [Candidatus Paceibacterota bacterium]
MFNISPQLKLVTHNGSFHADDIFAAATLSLVLEKQGKKFEIIRTRDEDVIQKGDYVFDVGGIYDADKNRFDHHQNGGAGKRENGIEYASIGLVWQKFGIELCDSQKATDIIDKRLIAPIDAGDNGMDLVESKFDVFPYIIQNVFGSMRPTWREKNLKEDEVFITCVEIAKNILRREIVQANDAILGDEAIFSIYEKTEDKRIIVLDDTYPFEYILHNYAEPLYVVYPRSDKKTWGAKSIRENWNSFKNRKNFPEAWAGLKNEDLAKVSGVPDAVFCHRGLFMAVANSREGAIKLAQIALES